MLRSVGGAVSQGYGASSQTSGPGGLVHPKAAIGALCVPQIVI